MQYVCYQPSTEKCQVVPIYETQKGMQGDGKPSFTTRKISVDSQQQIK